MKKCQHCGALSADKSSSCEYCGVQFPVAAPSQPLPSDFGETPDRMNPQVITHNNNYYYYNQPVAPQPQLFNTVSNVHVPEKPKKKHSLLKLIGWLMLIGQIGLIISAPGTYGSLILPMILTVSGIRKGNWLLIFIAVILSGALFSQ